MYSKLYQGGLFSCTLASNFVVYFALGVWFFKGSPPFPFASSSYHPCCCVLSITYDFNSSKSCVLSNEGQNSLTPPVIRSLTSSHSVIHSLHNTSVKQLSHRLHCQLHAQKRRRISWHSSRHRRSKARKERPIPSLRPQRLRCP